MPILLMRHAETAWPQVNSRQWQGSLNDLAPLTDAGRAQALEAGRRLSGRGIDLVLASPMTRALETACLVSSVLEVPMRIDLDLREWLPDETLSWTTSQQVIAAYEDMMQLEGSRPEGHPLRWEPLDAVRGRARAALVSLPADLSVLAVCHAVVIFALTGQEATEHCGVVRYERV